MPDETAWLSDLGSEGLLLAALLFAHAAGDFALQTGWMVREKHRSLPLFVHGSVHGVLIVVLTAPLLGLWLAIAAAALLGSFHAATDRTKDVLQRGLGPGANVRLLLFGGDQLLHASSILVVWQLLRGPYLGSYGPLDNLGVPFLILAAGYILLGRAGSVLTRAVLGSSEGATTTEHFSGGAAKLQAGLGERIGVLERWLLFTLILLGAWAAVGLYVGTKPIARFHAMREGGSLSSEHFLIGTLTSVLFAVIVAWGVLVLV